jgi:hypothetical protein
MCTTQSSTEADITLIQIGFISTNGLSGAEGLDVNF